MYIINRNQQIINMENNATDIQDVTSVKEVDVNLDELFGVDTSSIMTPTEKEKTEKPNIFSNPNNIDLSFIDNPEKSESKETEITETIQELEEMITGQENSDDKSKSKVKAEKESLLELANKMIEEGTLIAFDDEKELSEYSVKDFRELFEANFKERENNIKKETPKAFFNSLPEELQIAAKYVADGGQDLKGLFRTLAQVEELIDLDVDDLGDQEEITRQYLYATNFGTAEEIEEEIETWRDIDKIAAKAKQFKPKLDRMQEEIVARKLAEQEQKQEQQQQAARQYTDNVYDVLAKGELSGIKLDKKVQSMLYSGLVQPNYPSISGKPTNMLGHLLEKYQFVEPRHDLIAEALWLLSDPKGYKDKLKEQGSNGAIEKTVRTLKSEEQRKITSSTKEDSYDKKETTKKTISRNNNMFKRF